MAWSSWALLPGREPSAERKLSACCLAKNVSSSSSDALVSGWRVKREESGEGWPPPLAAPGPLSPAAPHLPPALPTTATVTWWDLVLGQDEAANAQELWSHIYNLWGKKG